MILGIDLGTTNSLAAYLSEDGPKLVPNTFGDTLTPSVVGIDTSGDVVVGRIAKELQVLCPERCASVFKRYMGSDWTTNLAGKSFSPEMLSSLVLGSLKRDAEAHLGCTIERAVITVPAYFSEPQRKATLNAGRMAGLKVERILNEPTAAALAYGFHSLNEEKIIVVVDLGGGTFDVSIVDQFEGALEVRASSGESFLGGEDFTRTLASRILESCGLVFERAEAEFPQLISRLLQQCEVAKCQLSSRETATVRVPGADGQLREDIPPRQVTREQFQAWTERTLARIELPIRRCLGDAKLKTSDLDEVILVGGATRLPQVIERVRKIFGAEPHCRLNPDEVVALGAAVQAGLIGQDASVSDMVVTDVAPFTLGIEIAKKLGLEQRSGYFMPIIHRNTTIPVSRVERVQTMAPNQTQVTVSVYQGEGRKVEQNQLLGEFTAPHIPLGPAGQEVDIRFTYDLNGVLEVEATIVATKKTVTHVITRLAHNLDEKQIQAAIAEMQQLKHHPREDSANRLALRRAERLFRELPAMERQWIADALDGFEAAMEMSDKAAIESHRQHLEELLDRFEQGFEGSDDHDIEDEPQS